MLSPKTSAFSVRFFVHAKQLFRCGKNYLSFSIQREMVLSISSIRAAHSSLSLVNIPSRTNKLSLFHRDLYLILEGRFSFLKNAGGKQKQQRCPVVTVCPSFLFSMLHNRNFLKCFLECWRPGSSHFHSLFPTAISIFIDSPYFQSRNLYSS